MDSTKRRFLLKLLAACAVQAAHPAAAQETKRPRRIAFLSTGSPASVGRLIDEFRAGLRGLGYVERRDIEIHARYAEGQLDRLAALAAELLALGPAVIVTSGSSGVAACQKATTTIPIVFASAGDPVGQGFVKSLRRPGGNITGVAFNDEINRKVYELAKEIIPSATRLAVLANDRDPGQQHHSDYLPEVAKRLRFEPMLVNVTRADALDAAFEEMNKSKVHGLVVTPISLFSTNRPRIVELALKYRLPSFFSQHDPVREGGLAGYSDVQEEKFRRAAGLVDKILKGANPADIPVEIPTKYTLIVNLKTAKALGVSVPAAVLVRADAVYQ